MLDKSFSAAVIGATAAIIAALITAVGAIYAANIGHPVGSPDRQPDALKVVASPYRAPPPPLSPPQPRQALPVAEQPAHAAIVPAIRSEPPAASPFSAGSSGPAARWTTRSAADCGKHFYEWHVVGNTFEFIDQDRQSDLEEIVDRAGDVVRTQTVASVHSSGSASASGTRWIYTLEPDGRVYVRNLQTGASFYLMRCPE